MAKSTEGHFGNLALALGAALIGFILGARVKIGNHGANIIIMPIGGDLVIVPPLSSEATSAKAASAEASNAEVASEEL